jgi:YMGG-like Gly-zipper
MKKIIFIATAIVVFAACKSKTASTEEAEKVTNKNMVLVDTSGLYKNNASTDVGDKENTVNANGVNNNNNNAPVVNSNKPARKVTRRSNNNNSGNNGAADSDPAPNNSGSGGTTGNDNSNTSNQGAAVPAKEKGWSDAAKGTAIGGGTGAVLGAVVSKNKGKGAVIGGIIGAGAGYVIGRSKDKKSGRVARQKARRAARNQ